MVVKSTAAEIDITLLPLSQGVEGCRAIYERKRVPVEFALIHTWHIARVIRDRLNARVREMSLSLISLVDVCLGVFEHFLADHELRLDQLKRVFEV